MENIQSRTAWLTGYFTPVTAVMPNLCAVLIYHSFRKQSVCDCPWMPHDTAVEAALCIKIGRFDSCDGCNHNRPQKGCNQANSCSQSVSASAGTAWYIPAHFSARCRRLLVVPWRIQPLVTQIVMMPSPLINSIKDCTPFRGGRDSGPMSSLSGSH